MNSQSTPTPRRSNPRSIRRGYTSCRFGHLHYRIAGPERTNRPPVVLLHQNPSSSFEYEPLIAALASDRKVIAFDTPGYGMSDAPAHQPSMADYAAAFADGLDALAATDQEGDLEGPVDVYGFHTGTLLAAELALLRPDGVRRMILTGIPMYPADRRAQKLAEAEDFPPPDEEGEVLLGLLSRLWGFIVQQRDKQVPLAKAVLNFADKARVLDGFTVAYRAVWSWDYARLGKVSCPVLVLQPAEDLRPFSIEAAKLLPHAVVRELPDISRDIFDIAPECIAYEIRLFLD